MDNDLEFILDHIDKIHPRSGLQRAADRIRERYSKNGLVNKMIEKKVLEEEIAKTIQQFREIEPDSIPNTTSRMGELLSEKEKEIDALKRETTADPFEKIKAMIDRSLLDKKMVMKIAKENRKEIDNLKKQIAAISDQ